MTGKSFLPFWNSELYVEISPCFPFGRDYHPVSPSRFHSSVLERISKACMDLGGEFFFMASPQTGCVGNLSRENFYKASPDAIMNLGFIMTLGYSEILERAVIASMMLPSVNYRLTAGIAGCSLWSRGVLEGVTKVIAVAGDEPFFDCTDYLREFAGLLETFKEAAGADGLSYYAERFGYDRFFVSWEQDDPIDIALSHALSEIELEETRGIVGSSPVEEFPPFMGAAVNVMNINEE